VDDVEVDLIQTEPLEALLRLEHGVLAPREELRRDEDLLPRDAAVAQRPSDARLVAIGLRGVDVAVAELERPADGPECEQAVRRLPDAESQSRHPRAVGEDADSIAVAIRRAECILVS
jgi:hypothetical protein